VLRCYDALLLAFADQPIGCLVLWLKPLFGVWLGREIAVIFWRLRHPQQFKINQSSHVKIGGIFRPSNIPLSEENSCKLATASSDCQRKGDENAYP